MQVSILAGQWNEEEEKKGHGLQFAVTWFLLSNFASKSDFASTECVVDSERERDKERGREERERERERGEREQELIFLCSVQIGFRIFFSKSACALRSSSVRLKEKEGGGETISRSNF